MSMDEIKIGEEKIFISSQKVRTVPKSNRRRRRKKMHIRYHKKSLKIPKG
jgi:hypothetical protein